MHNATNKEVPRSWTSQILNDTNDWNSEKIDINEKNNEPIEVLRKYTTIHMNKSAKSVIWSPYKY